MFGMRDVVDAKVLSLSQLSLVVHLANFMRSKMNLTKRGTRRRLCNTPRDITIKIILKKMTKDSLGAYSIPTVPNKVDRAPCNTGLYTERTVRSTISSLSTSGRCL